MEMLFYPVFVIIDYSIFVPPSAFRFVVSLLNLLLFAQINYFLSEELNAYVCFIICIESTNHVGGLVCRFTNLMYLNKFHYSIMSYQN